MATEDKRIDQLPAVSVLDLTSLLAMQQGTEAKKVTLQQLLDYLNGLVDTGNVVLFVAQTLTDEQKLQARTNIGAAAPGEGGGSAANAVLYVAQTLTEEQQHQARLNIRCGNVGVLSSDCVVSGDFSCAEGAATIASGWYQHVQGCGNIADTDNKYAHIVGNGWSWSSGERSNAHTLDWNGLGWFAGGLKVGGIGQDDEEAQEILPSAVQYVEQTLTKEQKRQARLNIECGSIGEVADSCVASGNHAHAEGLQTTADGFWAPHAEGWDTRASGNYAHSEGVKTEAGGEASHAEGSQTKAIGANSHAEGRYTIAARANQHTEGRLNIEDTYGDGPNYTGKYIHITGNGYLEKDDNDQNVEYRSNAHTLDWNGVPWFSGDRVMLGGTGMDDENAVALMPIFAPQQLTEAQKQQARENIGAATVEDVLAAIPMGEGVRY